MFADTLELEHVGADDDFFNDLGGDSLAVVGLMASAAKSGIELSPDAIYRGRTVAGVARLVEIGSSESMPTSKLIADTVLNLSFQSAPADPPRCVLITGASGLLGSALTRELSDYKVICMSRNAGMRGDVRHTSFGWDEDTWKKHSKEVDTVIHLAADVKLFATYDDLKESQVEGTRNVLKFCSVGRPKTLHYASTLSVFVDADPLEAWCEESDDRRNVTHLHGGYAQSKWVAEQLVLQARENGLRSAIHRLGLLSLSMETGDCADSDWLNMVLPGLAGQAADDSLAFDLTPVDYAARVMAWIISHNKDGIFHIANPKPVTQTRISTLRAENPKATEPSILAARRDHRSLDLFKCSGVRFDMSRTQDALAGSGIEFPEISDEYLSQCLQRAVAPQTS